MDREVQEDRLLDGPIGDADVADRFAGHVGRGGAGAAAGRRSPAGCSARRAGPPPAAADRARRPLAQRLILAVDQRAGLNVEGRIGLHGHRRPAGAATSSTSIRGSGELVPAGAGGPACRSAAAARRPAAPASGRRSAPAACPPCVIAHWHGQARSVPRPLQLRPAQPSGRGRAGRSSTCSTTRLSSARLVLGHLDERLHVGRGPGGQRLAAASRSVNGIVAK